MQRTIDGRHRRVGIARQDGAILTHQAYAVARRDKLSPELGQVVRRNVESGDTAERSVTVGKTLHDAEDRLIGKPADERAIDDKLGSRPRRLEVGAVRDVGV